MDSPDNYRPILVLPVLSKLIERLVHNQINDALAVLGALSDKQSGFRKGHSTTTCLIEFLDGVYHNMEEGNLTGVLFLDLRKAFDTVDHHILLCKLESIGLGQGFIQWSENYLTNRCQSTKISHVISDLSYT